MSSFAGHCLTGAVVFFADLMDRKGIAPMGRSFGDGASRSLLHRDEGAKLPEWLWCGILVVAANAPDLDYVLPILHRDLHGGLRISHSIGFAVMVTVIFSLGFWLLGERKSLGRRRTIGVFLAIVSHLVLDYCVGVLPLPLFWPFDFSAFKSPFGWLPSAGKISLTNYFLYRNLAIEMGILLPLYAIALWFWKNRCLRRWQLPAGREAVFLLTCFLMEAVSLSISMAIH